MLSMSEGIIEEEFDIRHVAQLQIAPYFPPDQPPGTLQTLSYFFLSLALTDYAVVNARIPKVVGQLHLGKSNTLDPRVFHDTLNGP